MARSAKRDRSRPLSRRRVLARGHLRISSKDGRETNGIDFGFTGCSRAGAHPLRDSVVVMYGAFAVVDHSSWLPPLSPFPAPIRALPPRPYADTDILRSGHSAPRRGAAAFALIGFRKPSRTRIIGACLIAAAYTARLQPIRGSEPRLGQMSKHSSAFSRRHHPTLSISSRTELMLKYC
jgi:hypothetical protein